MEPIVFVLVGVAAAFHVTWNVLLKSATDPLDTATIGVTVAAALLLPVAAVAWFVAGLPRIPVDALVLGAVSGVLEALYFILLAAAYVRGDLSVVYPLARGTAVLLAVAVGVIVLGERPGPIGWAGIAALVAGFIWLQRPWRILAALRSARAGHGQAAGAAVPFALATGAVIASYSAIDRVGSRAVAPWLYAAILYAGMVLWLLVVAAARGRLRLPGRTRRDVATAAMGGLLTLAAYVLILFAFSVAPLTAVAPLRESAVVLASGWGALRLGETAGRTAAAARIGAAGLIVVGAVLLALER